MQHFFCNFFGYVILAVSIKKCYHGFMVTYSIFCPHCQQAENVTKAGKSDAETQRYKCKDCHKTFATHPKTRQITPEKEELILAHLVERTSIRGICRAIKCAPNTIYKILEKNRRIT